MIIGTFNYNVDADTYEGFLDTMTLRIKLRLTPHAKSSDKEPDYRVIAVDEDREVGAGWKRKSDKGSEFVSVSIDDPSFPTPVNAALFLDEQQEGATLVWQRRKDVQKPVILTAKLAPETPAAKRSKPAKAA